MLNANPTSRRLIGSRKVLRVAGVFRFESPAHSAVDVRSKKLHRQREVEFAQHPMAWPAGFRIRRRWRSFFKELRESSRSLTKKSKPPCNIFSRVAIMSPRERERRPLLPSCRRECRAVGLELS